jgi:hypothetical protein
LSGQRAAALAVAAALVAAGVACAALVNGLVGELLTIGLISLGLLVVVGWLFLEVGRSEDRERAREQRGRRRTRPANARRSALWRRPRRPR